MSTQEHGAHGGHGHDDGHAHLTGPAQRRRIWMVFWIMFAITAVEFVIAFVMLRGMTRNVLFIGMTLVKAFYIVAEFMHLKHETRNLILTILVPLVFVIWLIIALLVEGTWYGDPWFFGSVAAASEEL